MDAFIRRWARNRGMQVGERGRLPKYVEEAFYAEFPQYRPTPPITNPNGTCVECYNPVSVHRSWCTLAMKEVPVTVTEYVTELPTEEEIASEAAETPENTPNPAPALSEAADMLTRALEALTANQTQTLDKSAVESIAVEVFETLKDTITPRRIEIAVRDTNTIREIEGLTHQKFEEVLDLLSIGQNVYLVGPAGTGKSTMGKMCADALGVNFYTMSCDSQMSSTALKGYRGVTGEYVSTEFREAYEHGGVFLLDEADQSHPSPLTWLNMAIENGHCAFPDKTVTRNPYFYVMVGANTFGTGATDEYVGANKQNKAFLDRFSFVEMMIDEALEEAAMLAAIPNNQALGREWLAKVREWRKNAIEHKVKILITPRAAIEGAKILATGKFTMERVAEMRVWKGIDQNSRDKVEGKF